VEKSEERWYKQSFNYTETGAYLGLNTNLDFLKAKLSIGTGWFFPHNTYLRKEFKAQLMFGLTFGVLGGGPLKRWSK